MQSNTLVVSGSIQDIVTRANLSIAESFLSASVICLIDVSGSMDAHDSKGGKSRYDVAVEELIKLQATLPGKIAVVAFSDSVQFCPSGVPPFMACGTDLAKALEFVKLADGTVRFVVISDGMPNEPAPCLKLAKTFKSRIDCIYVGPEDDRSGAHFLEQLAAASGGKYAVAAQAQQLAEKVQLLLKPGS
ncbi:MAG: vWA domain-containing protein [Chloroflexota bacterium]